MLMGGTKIDLVWFNNAFRYMSAIAPVVFTGTGSTGEPPTCGKYTYNRVT